MLMTRTISVVSRAGANWRHAERPHIKTAMPPAAVRALAAACRAVDKDVEQFGGVSFETVEQVRAALALARSL